jgi:hypothetical protein
MKKLFVRLVICLVASMAALPVTGQEPAKGTMSPEEAAMMEAWAKFASPGPGHAALEPMVGTFAVESTGWMSPEAAPHKGSGISENSWVLGGRYLQQIFRGEADGQPFEGISYTAYDNFKKRYVGTWIDTMGTGIMISSGSVDAAGKVFTLEAEMDDVVTGKPMKIREVIRVESRDRHVMEMYTPDRSGKEYKMMEIVYTRR